MHFGKWRQTFRDSKWMARLRGQGGQAMVEYSTVTFAILIAAGLLVFSVPINQHDTIAALLYKALQTYVDSVNFALSLAAT